MSDELIAPLNPLPPEHRALSREARRERRAFARSTIGSFARALEDAMTEYHAMRGQGVSREDACRGLALVLREAWPKDLTKFPPCPECDGTGWRGVACWAEQRCGRKICVDRHPSWEHAYVVPCDCPQGDRFRPRVREAEDEIAALGRTQKPKRGFSRFGS